MSGAPSDIEANAEMFRVLGHETRLRLLLLLAEGEHAVGEIDAVSGIGQPGLSQQLAILRKAQLVTTRRVAKQVYYRVNPAALRDAMEMVDRLGRSDNPAERPRPAPGAAPAKRATGSAARFARMI